MSTQNWPLTPDGSPEPSALLEWASDYPCQSGILLAQLEAFGIPFFTERPGLGELSFLYGGFSPSGICVHIPNCLLEEARAILSAPSAEDEDLSEGGSEL